MGKPKYSECSVWIVISMLVGAIPVNVTAQQGFISILCGGKANHTDENNIKWVTDDNYIDVGQTASTGDANLPFYVQNQRSFPKPLKKACYQLPIASNVSYLFRAWFVTANNGGYQTIFTFSVETLGLLQRAEIAVGHSPINYEYIFVSSGRVLYVCLTRTSEGFDPFINAIELRTLRDGMYGQAKTGSSLASISRNNVGGYYPVRYPQDNFDRIWRAFPQDSYASSLKPISANSTKNLPPISVMQTAWVTNQDSLEITIRPVYGFWKSLLVLYVAEIQMLNMSESRSFYVEINGEIRSDIITIVPYYSAMELAFLLDKTNTCRFDLYRAKNSTHGPILNAYELFLILDTAQATYQQDVEALEAVKRRFDIKDWISDPCYLIPWEGIRCDNRSSTIRISELNLGGRNFTGTVPADIGQLTGLVNLSLANNQLTGTLPNFSKLTKLEKLDLEHNNLNSNVPYWLSQLKKLKDLSLANNQLIGTLPNFSKLSMLERLHLQHNNLSGNLPDWLPQLKNLKELSLDNNNLVGFLPNLSDLTALEKLHLTNNNLSGTVPEWLSELKNLKELFIENNNFSGVIPAGLLNKTSLNLKYSGNQHLCIRMHKGKCVRYKSGKDNLSVVLGITISGALMVSLALMVVIAIHLQKRRSKQRLNEDHPMITVTNTTKCRAFTPEEIMAATQNFSRKIGQGGFGSVFFGKLRQGKEIAVKVLSLFSRQGIDEYQNEIDLLSRIHHINLVSLLGYCNESRELMLIYDHMSGGSLRDRLYGPSAGLSTLNWKTRLKIALDAAHGLEYLHVGCTPKIIHRDIKTSNILLDIHMNGKLADFGLSKMTIDDGAASHVTTMVKGTPGYLDPDYFRTQMLTEKSDIYSFGVVLLEIICGRPPIIASQSEERINLVQWVTPYVHVEMDENPRQSISGVIEEIIDKSMCGNYDIQSIVDFAKLALRCVDAKPSSRPCAGEVAGEIKEIIMHENKNNVLTISEEIVIEHGDSQAGPVHSHAECSKPNDMVWRDNSCNISQAGR